MKVHIPEPEKGYHFDKAKQANPKTRWRLLFFLVVFAIFVMGLIVNDFSFDFSDKLSSESRLEKYINSQYE